MNLLYIRFSSVAQASDSQRTTSVSGQTDHSLTSASHAASQSPPYTTPLSTKTELRSTRDHHVVDVRQQNAVVPPPQQAYAHSDKPSKLNSYSSMTLLYMYIYVWETQ